MDDNDGGDDAAVSRRSSTRRAKVSEKTSDRLKALERLKQLKSSGQAHKAQVCSRSVLDVDVGNIR